VRRRLERLLAEMELVRREEFEAVKAVAVNARAAQETLEARLARLEQALAEAAPTGPKHGGSHKPLR